MIDTSKNFALSVWAKLDDASTSSAVVATADSTVLSAGLYYDAGRERWAFGMTAADDKADLRVAHSRDKAATGVWTHLTGTYDAAARTLALRCPRALPDPRRRRWCHPGRGHRQVRDDHRQHRLGAPPLLQVVAVQRT